MRTLFSFFIIIGSALALASCSVYESNGRKSFEANAPGRVRTLALLDSTQEDLTCWLQPVDEALWNVPAKSELTIKKVSETTIEVCEDTL